MIISASYKTDIPAFYGEWFINRLRAGFCKTINPYNHQVKLVNLSPHHVDGIVFWTKNVGPFLKYLPEINSRGYIFIIHYTINNYPRTLEASVVDSARSVEHVKKIADKFGLKIVVWRYDPVLFSELTPYSFHIANFSYLASLLRGIVDEVVVSFVHLYKKTQRNIDMAALSGNFLWQNPADEEKTSLLGDLVSIAAANQMKLSVCSQPSYLIPGAQSAQCIDATRISSLRGSVFQSLQKGNRPGCMCYESYDIGEYDTCPQGCVYCYAVNRPNLAIERFQKHDPTSEFLFEPISYNPKTQAVKTQLSLFDKEIF